jgi:hypothetical protein
MSFKLHPNLLNADNTFTQSKSFPSGVLNIPSLAESQGSTEFAPRTQSENRWECAAAADAKGDLLRERIQP